MSAVRSGIPTNLRPRSQIWCYPLIDLCVENINRRIWDLDHGGRRTWFARVIPSTGIQPLYVFDMAQLTVSGIRCRLQQKPRDSSAVDGNLC